MDNIKQLNEEIICDIILCEPITRKGRESLDRLGLTTKEVDSNLFYSKLRVAPKYDEDKEFEGKLSGQGNDQNCLYYQYTVDYIQFEDLQNRLKKFNSRFCSNSPNEYPLLILGVAGNGKSIEVHRRVRELTSAETDFECGSAIIDLEKSITKITYGISYTCPSDSPLWLFCIELLKGIMLYIRSCHEICSKISDNFNNIVIKNNLANKELKQVFASIKNYREGSNHKETSVFRSLILPLSSQNAEKDIQFLLEILMWIMYCSDPNKKHYIVIDNIEQYIKLNDCKIQIPNSDIHILYKCINTVVMNMTDAFDRIESDLAWKVFKFVIVLRRTSLNFLDSTLLHSTVQTEQNITDVTGYIQIPDIWQKKKNYIWDKILHDSFNSSRNETIIDIVDIIMNDGVHAIGTDYQSLIAPLMSYGIRRNARAQAHAAYNTYKMLTNGKKENINLDEFSRLMLVESQDNSSVRYMFRRALIEFQFKWSLSQGNQNRWMHLGIGHLSGKSRRRSSSVGGFLIEDVAYDNPKCVTLFRRILTYLSYFPDNSIFASKSVAEVFSTISLYDLLRGVLVGPNNNEIYDDDFLQFAKVLIALSDMSNGDTKCAPYIILAVKNNNFHANTYEDVLAELLKQIWKAGYEKSLPGQVYNCRDFGARITDAGYSFLLDWHASFSFMASLHCFTIPSLYFLKDISIIKHVIKTVYNASDVLCIKYEQEAKRLCGENNTLKTGKYLPKHADEYITFRQRVKELHMNHLNLYRDFIQKNYTTLEISKKNMLELTGRDVGFISKYIDKYAGWNTMEGAPECF